MSQITDNEIWILSFYRNSEISGALFFGRLAKSIRNSAIAHDMTKHFADESMHAWYWTRCIDSLGAKPIRLNIAYQDNYLEAAGMPTNLMEILAITQVFERRVIGQYSHHRSHPGLHTEVRRTVATIMEDEKWHIQWIGAALKSLEAEYGADTIASTMQRFEAADKAVYESVLKEHEERIGELFRRKEVHSTHGIGETK